MKVQTSSARDLRLAQVSLCGPVTPRTTTSLRRVLDTATAEGLTHVILDLRDLDDVDPGLGFTLLDYSDRLGRAGGWLWLVHGPGRAGTSLRNLGVHDRVRSSPSRAAAGWIER